MILSNTWNLIAGMAGLSFTWDNTTDTSLVDIGIVDISGNAVPVNYATTNSGGDPADVVANWNPRAKLSLRIGTGTATPSADDYDLDTDITDSIDNYAVSVTTSGDDGKLSSVIVASGLNSTGTALAITEVGIVKTITTTSSNNYSHITKTVMLARHILSTPKVVPAGESFIIPVAWIDQ